MLDLDVVPGKLSEEPGWLLVTVLRTDSCDDDLAPRPRHRDVKQPPLLGEQPGDRRNGADSGTRASLAWIAAGHDVGKFVHAEERAALAEVGPAALLNTRDDDQVPLQPLGPVGRENRDGVARWRAIRERVTG